MGNAAGLVVQMKARIRIAVVLALWSGSLLAEWVRVAENNRLVAYADTRVQRTGNSLVVWVLFDYKGTQQSAVSGRRYLSEKAQREIDCEGKRGRVLFFTWHADQMGDGVVVYTGGKPTEWEPSSSPQSIGHAFWKYYCDGANTARGGESIEAQPKRVADETRKSLPMMVDNDVQATNIAAVGKVLMNRYNFTARRFARANVGALKAMYYGNSVNAACTNPETTRVLNNGVSFDYQYYDSNNVFVLQYTIDANTCRLKKQREECRS